ncbi:MAG: 2-C-methyl-D-erythritol 4-phosphate cytidylyltransferase [Solobacterium sp.]|nr:2-C-methyl-D-erythritol 4-phosphate cytidylyltransferase [Solobacterium sp.]
MKYSAVIVAAGSGSRMNLGFNKVYAHLPGGRTILEETMSVFLTDPDCEQIVVVTDAAEYLHHIQTRVEGRITFACGGDTRQRSVLNGVLAAISDIVFIHDGARPHLSAELLGKLKEAMETEEAALLAVPCKDTIKVIENGYVRTTVERSTVCAAQTPQAFRTSAIIQCIRKAEEDGYTGTDDCSLAEKYSDMKIKVVEGSYENFKITTPEDLR